MTDQEKLQELERRLLKMGLRAQKAEDDCSRKACDRWNDDEQQERFANWAEIEKAKAGIAREMLAVIWDAVCPTCGSVHTFCKYLNDDHGDILASMGCDNKHHWRISVGKAVTP